MLFEIFQMDYTYFKPFPFHFDYYYYQVDYRHRLIKEDLSFITTLTTPIIIKLHSLKDKYQLINIRYQLIFDYKDQ